MKKNKCCLCYEIGFQANVSPKVDFIEDNQSEPVPPKIQGVRVIVDATKMNGTFQMDYYSQF